MNIPTSVLSLRPAGQDRTQAAIASAPRSIAELILLLEAAQKSGRSLTMVGGRRSFGTQFLPPLQTSGDQTSSAVVSFENLPKETTLLQECEDGIWIRASGWVTFFDILKSFPGYVPAHPPTSKEVTLAGALSGATHNVSGFFSDSVRRISLLSASGRCFDCWDGAPPLEKRIFQLTPGAFGALGVVFELEVFLKRSDPSECIEVSVVERGKRKDLDRIFERMEEIYQSNEFPIGRGVYLCGAARDVILFGDRACKTENRPAKQLPLLGGSMGKNILLQGLSNRFPGLSQRVQPLGIKQGNRYWAEEQQFLFFQESYDFAHDWLSSEGRLSRSLRGLGANPNLPVAHQTWAFQRAEAKKFFTLYLEMVQRCKPYKANIELQDLIRIPRANSPLHPMSKFEDGGYLFTPSVSVAGGPRLRSVIEDFFRELSRRAYEECGAITLVLKQLHVDDVLVGEMYRELWAPLWDLKEEIDPSWTFSSRFLERLHRCCRS